MKKLINWAELSDHLTNSKQNIRKNQIPKKYQKKVNLLLEKIEEWNRWQVHIDK